MIFVTFLYLLQSAPGLGNTDVVIKDTKGTIVQGVKLLLKTKPGEIPFQPQFFTDLIFSI